jgi:protein-S-isoprenylcysteine O-methyltransferase Ste14
MAAEISPVLRQATAILYGVLCHAAFLVGVAAMIVAMYFGMSLSLGRLSPPWSWLANVALLIQLPLGHSFLLTRRGRALLGRLAPRAIGADLAPTTYVIIASLQVLALFALWSPSGIVWWQAEGPLLVVMTCLYAGSWLLLAKSMQDAGFALQTGLLGWWAVLRNKRPVYPPMPQSGLFRLTRQPIYVSFTLAVWTVPTWTPDQLAVALALTLYCLLGPLLKEKRFARIYGPAFANYRGRVPYWLPWPRPAQRPLPSALELPDGQ